MSVDGPPASGSFPGVPPAPSLVGEVIDGRYRILSKLGEGGMGEVYAAEHVHIEKRFAIKLLKAEIVSNAEAVKRFRQEARSSSSIGHRNIIGVEDFGQLPDGRIYMCMELLNGAPLNDMIQHPMAADRLLNILIQTGHGLAAAHAKGIIHRDMKPENVFVTIDAQGQDVPKLLDFGIAKVAGNDGQNNLTRTGTIFGTPFYMAPEQALGNPVDARTDIYAVGVIMYECFAGSLPFQGESFMGILTQHITTPAEPVAQRAAKAGRQLPMGLAEIVTRCMEKDPNLRYRSMDELVNALIGVYRGIAGPGMSTYMEAFPVGSAQHVMQPTPPPMSGPMGLSGPQAPTMAAPSGPYGAQPSQPVIAAHQTGGALLSSSGSGLYDPSVSAVAVPKKGKAGVIIAILALLVAGGGVAAFVVLGNKDKGKGAGSGSGSEIASNDPGSNGSGGTTTTGSDHGGNGGTTTTGSDHGGNGGTTTTGSDHGSNGGTTTTGSDHGSDTGSGTGSDHGGSATVTPPPANLVDIVVLTKPPVEELEIWEDGKKLDGDGVVKFEPGSPSRTLVIKAKGFRDTTFKVDGKKARLMVKLEHIPGVKPPIVTHPPTGPDCTNALVQPNNPRCQRQFCAGHGDDLKCQTE